MTFDDLEIFIAVCQSENLSAVAREIGCTQPAISQHIARLEKEFGIALLERRARGVMMTSAGRLFYEHALEGMDAIKLAIRQVKQLREGETGTLGISTGGTTVRHFMKDAVVQFREQYPKVQLLFHSANSHQRCIDALRSEQADLAFITMGAAARGLEQHPVVEMPWVLVVPESAPFADNGSIPLQNLKQIPYISLKTSSTSQGKLESALAEAGVQLRSSTLVDDWDTAILFAGMGLGYAITPALHAQRLADQDNVRMIPIEGVPPAVFGWASRRWNSLPRVAKDFIDIFADEISKCDNLTIFASTCRDDTP